MQEAAHDQFPPEKVLVLLTGEYAAQNKANLIMQTHRIKTPDDKHGANSNDALTALLQYVQMYMNYMPDPVWFSTSWDNKKKGFVITGPQDIITHLLLQATAIGEITIRAINGNAYKASLENYDPDETSAKKLSTVNYGWVQIPIGNLLNDKSLENTMKSHIAKAGISLSDFHRPKDKNSGATQGRFRFEFEIGINYNVTYMKELIFVKLGSQDARVSFGKEFCASQGLDQACLKSSRPNYAGGPMERAADVCQCQAFEPKGPSTTRADKDKAASAWQERARKRQAGLDDPFA